MLKLKTRTTLKRQGAPAARINRGSVDQRSALIARTAANRHCNILLAASRRAGLFNPPGGARVRGEP